MFRRVLGLIGRQSIAILALCVAVSGGTAYAASAMWTGANIVDGSLTGADIQNGSITSADLAPGAGSGGSSRLAVFDPAPVTRPWSSSATDPQYETIASQTFTMPSAGFITYQFSAVPTFSADTACDGDSQNSYVNVYAAVDGRTGNVSSYGQSNGALSNGYNPGSVYLTAGTHTLDVVLQSGYCPGTSTGTVTVGSVHMIADKS